MPSELPQFIKKIGEYKDKDKKNVLPGKNVAASFGPNSYSVLEEVQSEQQENQDKYIDFDELDDKKKPVILTKQLSAKTYPEARHDNSTKAKNAKTNRPFKDWQK